MNPSRRGVLGGVAAIVPASAADALVPIEPGRPPFHFVSAGTDRWRFRSWSWTAGAWRPIRGEVIVSGGEATVIGRPDPLDRSALQAALSGIARDGTAWTSR